MTEPRMPTIDQPPLLDDTTLIPWHQMREITLTGEWMPQPMSLEFEMRPISEVRKIVGRLVTALDVEIVGTPGKRVAEFWIAMDRRQARRAARKTGRTFRWTNGEPHWREAECKAKKR